MRIMGPILTLQGFKFCASQPILLDEDNLKAGWL